MKKLILSLILALFLFSGCKTKEVIRYVEIPNISMKIDSFTVERTDSFIQFAKNDTIYQQRFKTIYKDRIKIKIDSVSVPFEVVKIQYVDKEIIKYKHDTVWWVGLILMLCAFIFTAYRLFKR